MVDFTRPNDALKVRVACPNCGKISQLRNLSYKHICKAPKTQEQIEARCALKLKQLQQRAMSRLLPPGPPNALETPGAVECAPGATMEQRT